MQYCELEACAWKKRPGKEFDLIFESTPIAMDFIVFWDVVPRSVVARTEVLER